MSKIETPDRDALARLTQPKGRGRSWAYGWTLQTRGEENGARDHEMTGCRQELCSATRRDLERRAEPEQTKDRGLGALEVVEG